jgi:2-keto-3-deoxy-L-rhamnonate aldolase RhmA
MKTRTFLAVSGVVWLALIPRLAAQTEWENPVKKLLREGKPVVGMTVTVPSPDIVAQAAELGFDFAWIEMEHSPITLESARAMILATRGSKIVPIIRVPVNELWTAKRALDIGALGVIFPFTSTPELAAQAVAACRYPPVGKRGAGMGLATLRWPAPGAYSDFADQNALVIIIIEQATAVERIDEILAVPGIDVVFIGVTDLSYSMGLRGKQDDPKHQGAVAKIVASAQRHNLPVGRPAAAAQIPEFLKQGFQFFQAASELNMIDSGARPILEALGKKRPDPKTRPMY